MRDQWKVDRKNIKAVSRISNQRPCVLVESKEEENKNGKIKARAWTFFSSMLHSFHPCVCGA